MAEQECARQGQVTDMNPRQPPEAIPIAQGAVVPVELGPDMEGPTVINPDAGGAEVPETGAMLEPDLQAHIGRQLRAVYDGVVNEPVPDRFLRLLEELERKKAPRA